jgi:hypothetical protein
VKKIKLLILSISFFCGLYAQNNLMVIKVNGSIIAKTINKELKPGLEIISNEKFAFKTPTATASFIDPKSGKISQLNSKKNIYIPDIDVFEDRGEIDESLFSFFVDTIIFYQKIEVALPKNLYERFSNQEYILSILIDSNNVLISFNQIENKFVLQIDTTLKLKTGYYKAQLCSVKKSDKSISVLSDFHLVIPDPKTLINECSIIKTNTPDKASIKKNILNFIHLNYGKMSESDFLFVLNSTELQ